ncbi:hypothetical protein WA158_005591 [Blastocystis sp. Blastoise]
MIDTNPIITEKYILDLLNLPEFNYLQDKLNQTKNELLIEIRDCMTEGPESIGRAFSGVNPLRILICKNRVAANEIKLLLMHEMIHILDIINNKDLSNIGVLSCSEIKAAYFGECYSGFSKEKCGFVRKRCIRNVAIRNTKSYFNNVNETVSLLFEECLQKAMMIEMQSKQMKYIYKVE